VTHLVIIPSYNTGRRLVTTVAEAVAAWQPVWVVIDGSSDGSARELREFAATQPAVRVIELPRNRGKGAAVLAAAEQAVAEGFSHALVMDADGQHPAASIREFMQLSQENPRAIVAGVPQFGADAPGVRRQGRKLSVALVRFETTGRGLSDPLFGFRVYPLQPLIRVMHATRGGRRYEFDPEMAVRLCWAGVRKLEVPAPCRYLSAADGGVSHFHYVRDNLRMIGLHIRLLLEMPFRRRMHRYL
jgi:glycosyltransferase involved in cell wall biosynthesis